MDILSLETETTSVNLYQIQHTAYVLFVNGLGEWDITEKGYFAAPIRSHGVQLLLTGLSWDLLVRCTSRRGPGERGTHWWGVDFLGAPSLGQPSSSWLMQSGKYPLRGATYWTHGHMSAQRIWHHEWRKLRDPYVKLRYWFIWIITGLLTFIFYRRSGLFWFSWILKKTPNAIIKPPLSLMILPQNQLLQNCTKFVLKTIWNKYG